MRAIGVNLNDPLQCLEIGCGNGLVRRQLEANSRWWIDGTDIDINALKVNGVKRGETYLYNIHDRRQEMGSKYDAVVLFDVMEHIPGEEITDFLESCLFHLKPGGHLLINVPALMSLYSQYDRTVGHFRRYNKIQMRDELLPLGLKIRDMRYWGFSLTLLLLLRKVILRKDGPSAEIVKRGFKPPSRIANTILSGLGNVETALFATPPLGTSLMAAAQKSSND